MFFQGRLFASLYRYLTEILKSLLKLERSLACACTSCLVALKVLVCVLCEHYPSCVELFYQFFHCLKV